MFNQRYTLILAIVVISEAIISCESVLDVPAKGALSEEVLANQEGVNQLLVGTYGSLDASEFNYTYSEAPPNNWIYGSVVGGIAHSGGGGGGPSLQVPIANGKSTPNMRHFDSKWRANYEGISRANSVLNLLGRVNDMTEAEKNVAAAEARFLKAHYYFDLKKMFNMVPWIDEDTKDPNQPNNKDIWPNIEADFKFAMENLPEVQSESGRVNRWAAASYLAKSYVYQEKWQEAKTLFDDIISNGVTSQGVPYELLENYEDNFRPSVEDGNSEAVFTIEQVANDASGSGLGSANYYAMGQFPSGGPFPCCGYNQPTQDFVNSFRTNQQGLPYLDSYNQTIVKNDMNVEPEERFEPYQGDLDPRLDWTVGRRGVPYLDWGPYPGKVWISSAERFNVYIGKKHIYWSVNEDQYADLSSWAPGTAIDINVIRFADVLLLAAETEVKLGNLEQARRYVNRVRGRAGNSPVNNDLNRYNSALTVQTEQGLTSLSESVNKFDWVIVEDDNSTYMFLGGDQNDMNNWNKYTDPNYSVSGYSTNEWNNIDPIKAIRFERKLELGMEGHRFFDLVRWGIAEEFLSEFYQYTRTGAAQSPPITGYTRNNATFTPGKNEYFPIPQRQIELSAIEGEPILIQNPGY